MVRRTRRLPVDVEAVLAWGCCGCGPAMRGPFVTRGASSSPRCAPADAGPTGDPGSGVSRRRRPAAPLGDVLRLWRPRLPAPRKCCVAAGTMSMATASYPARSPETARLQASGAAAPCRVRLRTLTSGWSTRTSPACSPARGCGFSAEGAITTSAGSRRGLGLEQVADGSRRHDVPSTLCAGVVGRLPMATAEIPDGDRIGRRQRRT
jgi:hypothetical protein